MQHQVQVVSLSEAQMLRPGKGRAKPGRADGAAGAEELIPSSGLVGLGTTAEVPAAVAGAGVPDVHRVDNQAMRFCHTERVRQPTRESAIVDRAGGGAVATSAGL